MLRTFFVSAGSRKELRMRSIVLASLLTLAMFGQTQATATLEIYVIDVEGGNATLLVSPSKESLLIDTGNANGAVRDVNRIMEAVKDAGLPQIDHLITTHWHGDHFGGLQELSSRIPIREFIDHGPNAQPNAATDDFVSNVYPKLYAGAKHTVPKPGDKISVGIHPRKDRTAGGLLADEQQMLVNGQPPKGVLSLYPLGDEPAVSDCAGL